MGLGTGVEFEWSIVYHALLKSGAVAPKALQARVQRSGGKLQPWSKEVAGWAQTAVAAAEKKLGKRGLATAYHSDELNIAGNPEPKTDVVFKSGSGYYCSVKMRGPIQLSSGQGDTSASMFQLVGETLGVKNPKLGKVIGSLKTLPTKLISESNVARLKAERPDWIKQYLKNGKLLNDISFEYWAQHNLDAVVASVASYVESDPDFHFALIQEALTGGLIFKNNRAAVANYIITPDYFQAIDREYVRKTMGKTKIGIRAKSRGGISALAVRFDTKA